MNDLLQPSPAEVPGTGDMATVARHLSPTEAYLLQSCLAASGLAADVADVHLMQAHPLLAGAVGGASVRVRESLVPLALAVIAAFHRGDFALCDDFEEGDQPVPPGA